ncbi:MAG: hypothetical protein LR017_01170 [Candidatus Pacebacteria bacterium]|nr:hypothetical protein [Candidatus Paceibacterota bacterium]
MRHRFLLHIVLLGILVSIPGPYLAQAALVSFPGAEGFGRFATGGRGGEICVVTNTNDAGSGSLRACAEKSGKRIIVFKTGGLIKLNSRINVHHDDITIMGQTAPGDGIAIGGNALAFYNDNTIVRNIRVFPGDPSGTPDSWDAIKLYGSNSIFDHVSLGWGSDENFQIWTSKGRVKNTTIQWSVITEGLNKASFNPKGPHGYGLLAAPDTENLSIHHTIFTYNLGRSPLIYGNGKTEFINNSADDYMDFSAAGHLYNVINNYTTRGVRLDGKSKGPNKVYLSGNKSSKVIAIPWGTGNTNFRVSSPAFTGTGIKTQSATEANALNAKYAGAIIPKKDAMTIRAANRSGRMIDSMKEVGGWPNYAKGSYPQDTDGDAIPDSWEREYGLNPNNASDAKQLSKRGYMWIEEYANSLIPMHGFDFEEGLTKNTNQDSASDTNTPAQPTNDTSRDTTNKTDCGVYQRGNFPYSTQFGAPWNPLNPSAATIITSSCSDTTASVTAGSADTAYTWSQGYISQNGSFKAVTLAGDRHSSGWIRGAATIANVPIESKGTLFLSYICQYKNSKWYCGCSDTNNCGKWNLQLLRP